VINEHGLRSVTADDDLRQVLMIIFLDVY